METRLDVACVITTTVETVKNLYVSCSGQAFLPIICGVLAPFTLPGFRQTDWKMWNMTPCILDQLERVLLRDQVNFL